MEKSGSLDVVMAATLADSSILPNAPDIENITLLDLINAEELQQIQDVYAETIGIASIIADINGQPITQPSNFSRVCKMVRSTEKGALNCMHSGKILGSKAHSLLEPTYQRCLSCGFIDASAPIIVAGRHIANWIIGQVNPVETNLQYLYEYAAELGIDPDEMANALSEPRNMPMDQFEKSLRLLWVLSKKLSALAFNNLLLSKDNIILSQAEKKIKQLNQDLESRIWEYEAANSELVKTLARLQETQSQLIQKEKLASLGSLVAGIAHEINTPVGNGVTTASYLAQETQELSILFQDNKVTKHHLKDYLTACLEGTNIILLNLKRASELILSFKRVAVDQSTETKQVFNVKDYLEAISLSLRPAIKKENHTIVVQCSDFLEIESYPGDFSQIITNLIMNSLVHAYFPGMQGELTIEVNQQDDFLTITYSDDGQGIPEKSLKKIFQPFFTTRRGQGGTGLGLHIVYNIVTQRLKGTITCQSVVGKGTTFRIILPMKNGGTL